ncbi:MAG: glycosyltransferase family 2 protein [Bacillota bacterium]|nr:glycosyltransferase family 2 protein [Bacillota bacterium]
MLISLCVIAKNEENYIGKLLNDILNQTYPHNQIEIILTDNCSSDNTKKKMLDFQAEPHDFYDIKVLDAPCGNQASSWNIAIENASGDVIIRLDAHARIPKDFTQNNAKNIENGDFVVGGSRPAITDELNRFGRMLLAAEESLFGSSIATFRRKTQTKTAVSSLFHAAYRREVFEKVGGFNESLGRTEDNEFHYRIRKAGYEIYLCPDIESHQYIRNTFFSMIKQKFGNGMWIGLTLGVCPKCLSYYHFAPFLLILALIIGVLSAAFGFLIPIFLLLFFYLAFDIINTLACFISQKPNILYFFLPFLFPILHLSYGIGTVIGLIKLPFFKKSLTGKEEQRIEEFKITMRKNNLQSI